MKIALPEENGSINQHFGKSQFFAIVEVLNGKVTSVETVSATELAHDHGGLASLLKAQGVELALVGGIGPGALQALERSGIKIVTGAQGSIQETVQNYLTGALVSKGATCGNCHH